MDLNTIETEEQLDRLVEASNARPVVLFKHSTTCPVSSRAHAEVERFASQNGRDVDLAKIVVQRARPLSNLVEERFGVRHESPQVLVLRNGRVVWNASHYKVSSDSLAELLGE